MLPSISRFKALITKFNKMESGMDMLGQKVDQMSKLPRDRSGTMESDVTGGDTCSIRSFKRLPGGIQRETSFNPSLETIPGELTLLMLINAVHTDT